MVSYLVIDPARMFFVFQVMDHDIYSTSVIGAVYVDINPLLMRATGDSDKDLVVQGWFPLFDTFRGLSGYLNVVIKLQFIGNDNPFRDSSAGVQFFSTSTLSSAAFVIQEIIGLVADLVVEDDPEMSWQDMFRLSKASNDTRLRVLYNLSSRVRKELGKKVIEAGGNAVLGFTMHFDVEGDSGIVARAYGTACKVIKTTRLGGFGYISDGFHRGSDTVDHGRISSNGALIANQNNFDMNDLIYPMGDDLAEVPHTRSKRQHSNSELSDKSDGNAHCNAGDASSSTSVVVTSAVASRSQQHPHGAYPAVSGYGGISIGTNMHRSGGDSKDGDQDDAEDALDFLPIQTSIFQSDDVQLYSLTSLESHIRIRFGGLVMAKSVKFLGKLASSLMDQETREGWWEELRTEIKSHAKALCCTHVAGYSETCTIFGDVIVLMATGTAASVKDPGKVIQEMQELHEEMAATADTKWGYNRYADEDKRNASSPDMDRLRRLSATSEASDASTSGPPTDSGDAVRFPSSVHIGSPAAAGGGNFPGSRIHSLMASTGPTRRAAGRKRKPCFSAHVPYNRNMAPFAFMRLVPCVLCRRKWVPEFIISTLEPPKHLPIRGEGILIEAVVCRARKSAVGEQDAVKVSEVLPFIEFDIQRQLMLKLKIAGMNAAFGYRSQLKISGSCIIATASVTAVYIEALPSPPMVQVGLPASLKDLRLDQDTTNRLVEIHRRTELRCRANKLLRSLDKSKAFSIRYLTCPEADGGSTARTHSSSSSEASSTSDASSDSGSSTSSDSSSSSSTSYLEESDDVESVSLSRPSSESSSSSSSSSSDTSRSTSSKSTVQTGTGTDRPGSRTSSRKRGGQPRGHRSGSRRGRRSKHRRKHGSRSHSASSSSSSTSSSSPSSSASSSSSSESGSRRHRRHHRTYNDASKAGGIVGKRRVGGRKRIFTDNRHPFVMEVSLGR